MPNAEVLEYTSDTTCTIDRAHPTDAGIDLIANDNVTIPSGRRVTIPTGIRIKLPRNTVGLIWSRSGLAAKQSIDVKAGCIDEGYRGEVLVCLQNDGRNPYDVLKGDKIAQLLVMPVIYAKPVLVEDLNNTARGAAGFGSTGN